MKKIIAILLSVMIILLCFCACQSTKLEAEANTIPNPNVVDFGFINTDEGIGKSHDIIYDKTTKVMYAESNSDGSLCLLVNADGTPRLYEGD